MRGRLALAAAVLAALAAPATASGIYQPTVELSFDGYGPAHAPAVTSVMRQGLAEETTKTIAARFPPEFTFNPAFAVTGCSPEQEQARACPESSRLGLATVESPFGHGEGVVYLTSDFRLFVPFRAYGSLYEQPVTGTIHGYDAYSEIVFDNLPSAQVTEARIALDGGARSIFITPRRCGPYKAGARFVSHSGTQVETSLPLEITGCGEALSLSELRVQPRGVKPGGRPQLFWRLSRGAAGTDVHLHRAVRGVWRQVASTRGPGAEGENAMRLPRRWAERLRTPGRYRVRLRARTAEGTVSKAGTAAFRVRAP